MEKRPIFPKLSHSEAEEKCLRIFWCPEYDNCLSAAAIQNSLLDCSQCPCRDSKPDLEPRAAIKADGSNASQAKEKI